MSDANLGFRLGAQGRRDQDMKHFAGRRNAQKRRQAQAQSAQSHNSFPSQSQQTPNTSFDGLNSYGPRSGAAARMPSDIQSTQSPQAQQTELLRERARQRKLMRGQQQNVQMVGSVGQQQQQQRAQNPIQGLGSGLGPVLRNPQTRLNAQQIPQFDASALRFPTDNLEPVNVNRVPQDHSGNSGLSRQGHVTAPHVPQVPHAPQAFSAQQPKTQAYEEQEYQVLPNPQPQIDNQEILDKLDLLTKKLSELEKNHHEILVLIQKKEIQHQKSEVSLRAIQKDLVDVQRASNPIGQHDQMRQEMRELKEILTNSMVDTSNRMQDQVRVLIEQSENAKEQITQGVEEMLHNYHNMLHWCFATVNEETGGQIYDQCSLNSVLMHTVKVGSQVLLHHPMTAAEDGNIWMKCRYVTENGTSKMGNVCIFETPDKYNVSNFGLIH
jgi:hypothetical protein